MSLEDNIKNNPALVICSALLAGFLSGIATFQFLENRENRLEESLVQKLQTQNEEIAEDNRKLQAEVRDISVSRTEISTMLEAVEASKSELEASVREMIFNFAVQEREKQVGQGSIDYIRGKMIVENIDSEELPDIAKDVQNRAAKIFGW